VSVACAGMGAARSSASAVHVEGVTKRFGATRALAGVDLDVAEGTVFGLLGPNGAGKTTLVRVLATLLAPDSGRAEVFGRDVVQEPVAVRQLLGLTGQFAAVDEIDGGVPGSLPEAAAWILESSRSSFHCAYGDTGG
jgi:ABC-type Mn2+/Zn2+ transport system ATPase subunit